MEARVAGSGAAHVKHRVGVGSVRLHSGGLVGRQLVGVHGALEALRVDIGRAGEVEGLLFYFMQVSHGFVCLW